MAISGPSLSWSLLRLSCLSLSWSLLWLSCPSFSWSLLRLSCPSLSLSLLRLSCPSLSLSLLRLPCLSFSLSQLRLSCLSFSVSTQVVLSDSLMALLKLSCLSLYSGCLVYFFLPVAVFGVPASPKEAMLCCAASSMGALKPSTRRRRALGEVGGKRERGRSCVDGDSKT